MAIAAVGVAVCVLAIALTPGFLTARGAHQAPRVVLLPFVSRAIKALIKA
jgi:hypothetical protein